MTPAASCFINWLQTQQKTELLDQVSHQTQLVPLKPISNKPAPRRPDNPFQVMQMN